MTHNRKIIFVCVYKSGGDFGPEHVEALRHQLKQHITIPFRFWCLTDKPVDVQNIADTVVELKHNLPGWWSKIELFRPIYERNTMIVYFDLDVLLLKNIDRFIETVMQRHPMMLRSADRVGKANDWPSSSIMTWKGNELEEIYTKFIELGNVIEESIHNTARAGQQGDQGFIRGICNPSKLQDYLPDNYILYKIDYLQDPTLFEQARILNWTGKPRFQFMNYTFRHIKEVWEQAAYTLT